jgi:iron-sulfur cluster protein
MSARGPRDLPREIKKALGNPVLKEALTHAVTRTNALRRQVIARFPGFEAARDDARDIKERAIAELPEHLKVLEAKIEAQGGHVHHAEDAAAAGRIVSEIAKQRGARRVVKVKSMTSEEIDLNSALEEAGLSVRETDLGEYIIQITGDRPSHITAPIIHKSVEEVRYAFMDSLGTSDVPREPEELTQLARRVLRDDFLAADMGVSGANFVLADTGTVVVVTNEGNGRLTTQLPPVHVAIAGIDKVLPRARDLQPFLQLLPRSATGQLLTTYVSFISGPGWAASPFVAGKKRHFHLVLLDNGRMQMRDDETLREALYCIRCGACMTVCPPYQALGGHVYGGHTYHSGIGNAWEAGTRGLDEAAEFNDLCTTCSRCRDVCPVHIDIPWMNAVLRGRVAAASRPRRGIVAERVLGKLLPDAEDHGLKLRSRFFGNPLRVYRAARAWAPLSSWVARMWPSRLLMRWLVGLDARRRLPLPSRSRLATWHRQHGGTVVQTRAEAEAFVPVSERLPLVLIADCHLDYLDVDAGKAAITALEKLGFEVAVVAGQCCGRASLSQGMMGTAREQAAGLQRVLEPLVAHGLPVIGVEPSCLAALVDEHPRLARDGDETMLRPGALEPKGPEAGQHVASSYHELLGFIDEIARQRGAEIFLREDEIEPVTAILHGHCQQKTMGWLEPAVSLLGRVPGIEVHVTTAECCGMAGSFGFKADFADVSIELGRRLLQEIDTLRDQAGRVGASEDRAMWGEVGQAASPHVAILASGTSCRSQIDDLSQNRARHPIELIVGRLR